jgi:hypothetical protein
MCRSISLDEKDRVADVFFCIIRLSGVNFLLDCFQENSTSSLNGLCPPAEVEPCIGTRSKVDSGRSWSRNLSGFFNFDYFLISLRNMIKVFPIWFIRLSGVSFLSFEELRLSGFRFIEVGLWFSFIWIMWIYMIQRLFAGVLDILDIWQSLI